MKIGYKIILGSLLIGVSFSPSKNVINKYKEFKRNQMEETRKLLGSFKTRPNNFFTNSSYEAQVKSYMEKNIQNIELDLTAPDEPLKIEQSTSVAFDLESTSSSINSSPSSIIEPVNTPTVKTETNITKKVDNSKIVDKQPEKKEPEKKVVIEGTKVQDKKVDDFEYYVQLGVFNSQENANNLLKKVGGSFVLVKSSVNANQYIVRSNPGTKEEMEKLKQTVKQKDSSINPMIRVW